MDRELIGKEIIDSAIKVHRFLGQGLLESAYQRCLAIVLHNRGFDVKTEVYLPVEYEGVRVENAYRVDMMIGGCVLIENKVLDVILSVHKAQLATYLRLSGLNLGYLLNWNVELMKKGLFRITYPPEKFDHRAVEHLDGID